jgi:hypothetical protein
VIKQGDEGKSWYIILKGSVNVTIFGKVSETLVYIMLFVYLLLFTKLLVSYYATVIGTFYHISAHI